MQTREISWSDTNGRQRVHIIDPDTTKVKAIAEEGRKLIEAHAAFTVIDRERRAAEDDPRRLAHEAKLAAAEAGREGTAVEPKKLRKKIRDAEEHLGEVQLEWEAAAAKLSKRRYAYLAAVTHHAPALAAEAKADVDAGILGLASASQIARKANASMSGALAILGGLGAAQDRGDEFVPRVPKSSVGEFGMGRLPGPYVGEAVDHLSTAIGLASQILDDMKKAEKERKLRADLDAEVEAAPDLPDDEDDDEDDEVDPNRLRKPSVVHKPAPTYDGRDS